MTTVNRTEYGKALSTYGFNYHNVIRYRRDNGIDKVSKRQEISRYFALFIPNLTIN